VASLSTIYQDGQVKALQAVVDGLAQLPVRSLVTTGPSISPTQLTAPANVDIRTFVPHTEVLPRASLMISHGGHSTTMTALGYDLPLVIMPMFAKGDQPVIGRALERLGAARVVAKNAPAERIAAVVTGMLAEPSYRASAQALGAEIRKRDGAVAAADAIERQLAQPVQAGYPRVEA